MTTVTALFMIPTAVIFPTLLREANSPPSSVTLRRKLLARSEHRHWGEGNGRSVDQRDSDDEMSEQDDDFDDALLVGEGCRARECEFTRNRFAVYKGIAHVFESDNPHPPSPVTELSNASGRVCVVTGELGRQYPSMLSKTWYKRIDFKPYPERYPNTDCLGSISSVRIQGGFRLDYQPFVEAGTSHEQLSGGDTPMSSDSCSNEYLGTSNTDTTISGHRRIGLVYRRSPTRPE